MLKRQELGSWYRSYNGPILSCLVSPNLQNRGASSASHLGSITVTSLMYSLLVITNSLYITQSSLWKTELLQWIYTGWFSTKVWSPCWGSFMAAWKKNPDAIAFLTFVEFLTAHTSSLYPFTMVCSCFLPPEHPPMIKAAQNSQSTMAERNSLPSQLHTQPTMSDGILLIEKIFALFKSAWAFSP